MYRQCVIDGSNEIATFIQWLVVDSCVMGIVEFENGRCEAYGIHDITFLEPLLTNMDYRATM